MAFTLHLLWTNNGNNRNHYCINHSNRIIQSCQNFEERGWVPVHAVENIGLMYAAYHELGDNEIVTKLYNEFQKLPHIPPEGRGRHTR